MDETNNLQVSSNDPVNDPATENQYQKLAPLTEHLIKTFVEGIKDRQKSKTPIHVDEIASKVAKLYELIRKVVDWKDDNVLRRSAIERILKRLIFTKISGLSFSKGVNENDVAEIVTVDLIRGGHLPNDQIPREVVSEMALSLKKYLFILEHTQFDQTDPLIIKTKVNFYTFILEIAACEAEEILTNPVKENSLILTMSQVMNERIKVIPEKYMSPEEKYTQIYIAVCRTLFDLDDSFITYHLLKHQYAKWSVPDEVFMKDLQNNILNIWHKTEEILEHPLSKDFNAICEKIDTVFVILGDFLEEYRPHPELIENTLKNKKKFETLLSKYYDKRFQTLKKRLFRLGIFSTLSVFLSNGVTFFLIEVPMAEIFYEGFNLFTSLVDFLVPSAMMFFLVSIIKPPGGDNKNKVIKLVEQFVYEANFREYSEIYAHRKRNPVIMVAITLIYLFMTIIVFTGVAAVFYYAQLPITSVIFDTATIAMTVFAAVIIRNKSKELSVDDKTHFGEFILDMISVPIAKIGSYLARKWKEYNIVAIFFTFIIETPFVLILDFIENWSQYLKERRAELH